MVDVIAAAASLGSHVVDPVNSLRSARADASPGRAPAGRTRMPSHLHLHHDRSPDRSPRFARGCAPRSAAGRRCGIEDRLRRRPGPRESGRQRFASSRLDRCRGCPTTTPVTPPAPATPAASHRIGAAADAKAAVRRTLQGTSPFSTAGPIGSVAALRNRACRLVSASEARYRGIEYGTKPGRGDHAARSVRRARVRCRTFPSRRSSPRRARSAGAPTPDRRRARP
jgi:hypothetical protein